MFVVVLEVFDKKYERSERPDTRCSILDYSWYVSGVVPLKSDVPVEKDTVLVYTYINIR
jgi:hypothetical protein